MGIKHMSGSPWHIEYGSAKEEGEKRRHKRRCVFFRKENYCKLHSEKCCGSGICEHYAENIIMPRGGLFEEDEEKEVSIKQSNSPNRSHNIAAWFTVKNIATGRRVYFKIVPKANLKFEDNNIDLDSSFAKEVIGSKAGDTLKDQNGKEAKYILVSKETNFDESIKKVAKENLNYKHFEALDIKTKKRKARNKRKSMDDLLKPKAKKKSKKNKLIIE